METRNVEIYSDGRMGFAGPGLEHVGSMLGECAVPDMATINSEPEFRCRAATQAEFEDAQHPA